MISLTLSPRTGQSIQSSGSQQGATEPPVDIWHTCLEMFWVVTEESAAGIYLEVLLLKLLEPEDSKTAPTTEIHLAPKAHSAYLQHHQSIASESSALSGWVIIGRSMKKPTLWAIKIKCTLCLPYYHIIAHTRQYSLNSIPHFTVHKAQLDNTDFLIFYFPLRVDIQYHYILVSGVQHSGLIFMIYKAMPPISLELTWHCTYLLQYYCLFPF